MCIQIPRLGRLLWEHWCVSSVAVRPRDNLVHVFLIHSCLAHGSLVFWRKCDVQEAVGREALFLEKGSNVLFYSSQTVVWRLEFISEVWNLKVQVYSKFGTVFFPFWFEWRHHMKVKERNNAASGPKKQKLHFQDSFSWNSLWLRPQNACGPSCSICDVIFPRKSRTKLYLLEQIRLIF